MKRKSQKNRLFPIHVWLPDLELEEIAGHLDSQQRLILAERFEKWAYDLKCSALKLNIAGDTAALRPKTKMGLASLKLN
jgi:hypothetical protein